MPNKIAAITMVKNEADIIESFVRHTLKFADVLLVTDHQSTDETPLILQKLIDEGLPLYVNTFTKAGKFQSEVMTGLMYRAFDEYGADLAVALDADEFLLHDMGGSEDLRAVLQSAATNEVYYIEWINYELAEPEKDADKFILSRSCRRSTEPQNLRKVIVGKKAALEKQLVLTQGNHWAVGKDDAANWYNKVQQEFLNDIHLAHFPWRSQGQQDAKNLSIWLTNLARFSKNTTYADTYHEYFNDFVKGKVTPLKELPSAETADLLRYAGECGLKYTVGNVNSYANILRLAEIFAEKSAKDTVLLRQKKVTLLIVYDGDTEDFARSVMSAVAEPYPYKEFFVLARSLNKVDDMVNICKRAKTRIDILTWDNLGELKAKVTGEYVKWLLPGDELIPGCLSEQVTSLELNDKVNAVCCNEYTGGGIKLQRIIVDTQDENSAYFFNSGAVEQAIVLQGTSFGSLASILFRRESMMIHGFLKDFFRQDALEMLSVWLYVAADNRKLCGFIKTKNVKVGAKQQSADAFINHNILWYRLIEQRARAYKLEVLKKTIEKFYKTRAEMLPKLKNCADPKLLEKYARL